MDNEYQLSVVYFKDGAKVNFLINSNVINKRSSENIPKTISYYQKYTGKVNRADAILSKCMYPHRNRKWTDVNFKTCLKFAVDNN